MKKKITITLRPISVVVEGKDERELLENAKRSLIEQLNQYFPPYSYSINDADALDFSNVTPGMIVQDNRKTLGIITAVNEKTINVALAGGRLVQASPQLFQPSDATFEEARSRRITNDVTKEMNIWREGDSGYMKSKYGIDPVVVGKKPVKKYKLFIVNGGGRHFSVTEDQLHAFMKEEKEEITSVQTGNRKD